MAPEAVIMIRRDKYLNQLIKARNNGFPKVVTGVRRCGKSYLLEEIFRSYLLSDGVKDDNIVILELDDDKNSKYRDPLKLGSYVRDLCKGKDTCYVFLDEIQMVYPIINPNLTGGEHMPASKKDEQIITFVDVILGLSRETNIDLYVTGSNSKMLSSDIVTAFRDKATNIQLFPLSFEEFNNYSPKSAVENIYEYMQYGGNYILPGYH